MGKVGVREGVGRRVKLVLSFGIFFFVIFISVFIRN